MTAIFSPPTSTRRVADVKAYGAVGDGTTDDTSAIAAAIATGLPVYLPTGTYKVTDILTLGSGQRMYGDGRTLSIISVEDDFNMSALGVIRLGTTEPGAELYDIGIMFEQDSAVAVRASVNQYPPAIYAVDAPRFVIDRVRISKAWVGIDATGNTGGAWIGDVEVGALSQGIVADGALDFFHIGQFHFWPFGMSSGAIYTDVYSDGETIALDLTDIDGLDALSISTFRGKVILREDAGSALDVYGTIGQIHLDGINARLEMAAGNLHIGALYKSTDIVDDQAIVVTGGYLKVGQWWITHGGVGSTEPLIDISAGRVILAEGSARAMQPSHSIIEVSGGDVTILGLDVPAGAGSTRTAPFIDVTGGRVTIDGATAPSKGVGSGTFIRITTDGYHRLSAINPDAWTMDLPTTRTQGEYGDPLVEDWTPVLTFATAGTSSVSYTTQIGKIIREPGFITAYFDVGGTLTKGTASGHIKVTGLSPAPAFTFNAPATIWNLINLDANYTHVNANFTTNDGVHFTESGDAVSVAFLDATHVTNGQLIRFAAWARYPV